MSANNTKQAFANICDRICTKILAEEKMDFKSEVGLYRVVAQLAMVSWNTCNTCNSLEEAKEKVTDFAEHVYNGDEKAKSVLYNAASIKWHDYMDDKTLIASTGSDIVDGKPRALAFLKGELPPEAHEATNAFRSFMESPEVQERLKNISPENLDAEIKSLVAEYNANLPPVEDSDDVPIELYKHPLDRKTFDRIYQRTLWEIPLAIKKKTMKNILKEQPFLVPLCKDFEEQFKATERRMEKGKTQSYPGSLSEMILAITATCSPTVDYSFLDKAFVNDLKDAAEPLVAAFLKGKKELRATADIYDEPNLIEFICDLVPKFGIPENKLRKTMKDLLAWALAIETVRNDEDGEPSEDAEEYDFDPDDLQVFQLRVELLGYDVIADVQVREDMTFEALHQFLNTLFGRDDDHLYRFECDDDFVAIHPVEDQDDYDEDRPMVHSNECYIGHHLSRQIGAYYIFDYGEEWEHDIKVKKVLKENPDEHYPKVIKIKGDLPEQYPDYDDEV